MYIRSMRQIIVVVHFVRAELDIRGLEVSHEISSSKVSVSSNLGQAKSSCGVLGESDRHLQVVMENIETSYIYKICIEK